MVDETPTDRKWREWVIRRLSEGGSVRCVSSILSTITSTNVVNMLRHFAGQSPLYTRWCILLFSPSFGVQLNILATFSLPFRDLSHACSSMFYPKLYAIYLIGLSGCTSSTVDKLASGLEETCYARFRFRFSGRQSEISFDFVSVWRYHRVRTSILDLLRHHLFVCKLQQTLSTPHLYLSSFNNARVKTRRHTPKEKAKEESGLLIGHTVSAIVNFVFCE